MTAVSVSAGFDQYGYNYKANIFNGEYCNYDRATGGDFCDVNLQMKWNDAWLNEEGHDGIDNDGDLLTDEYGEGRPDDYIGSGAWLTNHDTGVNEDGSTWTYFVKIVAKPETGYDCEYPIWGDFCVIQQVVTGNPPSEFTTADEWPLLEDYNIPTGPGLGNW